MIRLEGSMRFPSSVIVAGLALVSIGCAGSVDYIEDPDVDPWGYDLDNARIAGEIGRFTAQTNDAYGWADVWDSGMFVDVRGRGQNGIVMAMLDVSNVDVSALAVGDVLQGTNQDVPGAGWKQDEAWVTLLGCGGEIDDVWEVDEVAQEVEVEVVGLDEKNISIEFRSILDGSGEVIEGEVSVPLL